MRKKHFRSEGEKSADRIQQACIELGVHDESERRRKPSVIDIYDYCEQHRMNFQHLYKVIHGKKYEAPDQKRSENQ